MNTNLSPFEIFLKSNASIDIMSTHVFPHIYSSDRRVLSNVSKTAGAFMLRVSHKRLNLFDFSNSVSRMTWLRDQGYGMHAGVAEVCGRAAADGNMPLLKWLSAERLFSNSMTTARAALHGHIDVLMWLKRGGKCLLYSDAFVAAAEGGHIHILQWMLLNGSVTTQSAFVAAATGGWQHVVDWLLPRGGEIPHKRYVAAAARSGALEMLKLHVTRLNANFFGPNVVPGYHGLNPGFYLASGLAVLNEAAAGGHVSVLEWLQTLPRPTPLKTSQAMSRAVKGGHKPAALWLFQQGCLLTTSNALEAAAGSDIDMLIWLRKLGSPWNKDAIVCEASRKRNRAMFEWVISQPNV